MRSEHSEHTGWSHTPTHANTNSSLQITHKESLSLSSFILLGPLGPLGPEGPLRRCAGLPRPRRIGLRVTPFKSEVNTASDIQFLHLLRIGCEKFLLPPPATLIEVRIRDLNARPLSTVVLVDYFVFALYLGPEFTLLRSEGWRTTK